MNFGFRVRKIYVVNSSKVILVDDKAWLRKEFKNGLVKKRIKTNFEEKKSMDLRAFVILFFVLILQKTALTADQFQQKCHSICKQNEDNCDIR